MPTLLKRVKMLEHAVALGTAQETETAAAAAAAQRMVAEIKKATAEELQAAERRLREDYTRKLLWLAYALIMGLTTVIAVVLAYIGRASLGSVHVVVGVAWWFIVGALLLALPLRHSRGRVASIVGLIIALLGLAGLTYQLTGAVPSIWGDGQPGLSGTRATHSNRAAVSPQTMKR